MPTMNNIKKSQLAISEHNASFMTKSKRSQETIETQYKRAHRKAFAKYLADGGLPALDIQRILEYYDTVVLTGKKNSNIMQLYPHSMETFIDHMLAGTLGELANKSETITHCVVKVKLAADPQHLKKNPNQILPEPPNRKVKYLNQGVSYRNL